MCCYFNSLKVLHWCSCCQWSSPVQRNDFEVRAQCRPITFFRTRLEKQFLTYGCLACWNRKRPYSRLSPQTFVHWKVFKIESVLQRQAPPPSPEGRPRSEARWHASSCLYSWWPAGCRPCWRTCWGWRRCGSRSFSPAPRSPGSRSGPGTTRMFTAKLKCCSFII